MNTEKVYISYAIVKYNEDTFDNLNGYKVFDDPVWDYDDNLAEIFPFQVLGECECVSNVPNWYGVIAGFHTEDGAKMKLESLKRADEIRKAYQQNARNF